jgi:hypothetical protein
LDKSMMMVYLWTREKYKIVKGLWLRCMTKGVANPGEIR